MRKADYATLATIIAQSRMDKLKKPMPLHEFHKGQLSALETVARLCADGLHVDKAEFLKACGIE